MMLPKWRLTLVEELEEKPSTAFFMFRRHAYVFTHSLLCKVEEQTPQVIHLNDVQICLMPLDKAQEDGSFF